MYRALFITGWIFAHLPEIVIRGFCWCLGALFFLLPSRRRHILFSNLHHAFPDRSPEWLRRTVWRICQRTVEMGLFTIACPHFSTARMKRVLTVPEATEKRFEQCLGQERPVLIFGAHFSMIEAFNAWPGVARFPFPETAVMFRPHKHPMIDQMIKTHRERFGMKLVSRKEGIRTMGEVLRRNGIGAILFDQNARDSGSLMPFFGRVTSVTELPGLMAKKYNAIPVAVCSHRTRFWRASIELEVLDAPADPGALTLASNAWLERVMKESDERCVDWLWTHNRWKILFRPHERLGMNHRKKLVDFSHDTERRTRFLIVVSDWPRLQQQAMVFFDCLRKSRPDATLTLVAPGVAPGGEFAERLDEVIDLPGLRAGRLALAGRLAPRYFDLVMVLEDDATLQQFARRTGVPQRFGVSLDGNKRKHLTDIWTPEDPDSWLRNPDWLAFGRHFGLEDL